MDKHYYCIIMAGGIGSRFWPFSKLSKPKQFLDILGTGKTLLQATFERFNKIFPSENIYVVTSSIYHDLVREQVPQINESQILLEPFRRSTAPCIAYASYKIKQLDPDAVFVVAPSDHLILDEGVFLEEVKKGLLFVEKNNALLTLGLHPTRPETGYGYIQCEKNPVDPKMENLRHVKTFTEKPDLELAKVFAESGEFYWNSGIFLWSANSIIPAFENHLPEVAALFNIEGVYWTDHEDDAISKIYSNCRNISVDYGIMEKAENVFVLTADFGWSDLGTWSSLYDHSGKDEKGNTVEGENVFLYDSENSIIKFSNDKIVVLHGLKDYIVVEADNILLACKKEDEQMIKNFVNDVKLKMGDKVV
jgi:mannose-1-phosphate guanylyltransferase